MELAGFEGRMSSDAKQLDPAALQVCIAAYSDAVEILDCSSSRHLLSDTTRAKLAQAVIDLAEGGLRNPVQLRDEALARVGWQLPAGDD